MKIWKPYELHTHTFHSDGKHSLMEMATEAKKLGLKGLALTDHNTMSGLFNKGKVESELDIHIMKGLEWTTFFGHMVVLGVSNYIDWREFTPRSIHKGIKEVHKNGGIVGIVHPYRIGSPICTGCFWEYEVEDWNEVDYIEVWSGTFPSVKKDNARAFSLWTEKLNEGYKISAVNGRDWHETTDSDEPIAATFINVENLERSDDSITQSIRRGEISVSMGPLLEINLELGKRDYNIGEVVSIGATNELNAQLNIKLDYSVRDRKWDLPEQQLKICINSNKGNLVEELLSTDQSETSSSINIAGLHWVRAEMYGVFNEVYTMIGFTNPIYMQQT